MHPRKTWILALFVVLWTACGSDSEDDTSSPTEFDPASAAVVRATCGDDIDCDDGLVCNGEERCDEGLCVRTPAPECDDGIACTVDRCSEDAGGCLSSAPDEDDDGHGDANCQDDDGEALGDDCDDSDPGRYPGNTEVCDAEHRDEDCDPGTFGLLDADGDGAYNANCCNEQPGGDLTCGQDCDDANPRVLPGATEACDGFDNDCNGALDHPLEDQDGDGVGNIVCGGTDCDDLDPMTFAGADEWCDGVDNNCSSGGGVAIDELDADGDEYVAALCLPVPDGLQPDDCRDDNPAAFPGAQELCNNVDDDCDGTVDEGASDCTVSVIDVALFREHGCGVMTNGHVYCWGRNEVGHLGTGTVDTFVEEPSKVLDDRDGGTFLSDVKAVSTGWRHSCALHRSGKVSCWGQNGSWGALGIGRDDDVILGPSNVEGIDDAVEVQVGEVSSCVRHRDGGVSCWGDSNYGQVGDGFRLNALSPKRVEGVDNAIDLTMGYQHVCVALDTGRVKCWGEARWGQLGAPIPDPIATGLTVVPTPRTVFGITDAVSVTASGAHTCTVQRDSTMRCWGANYMGQLGNGSNTAGSDVIDPRDTTRRLDPRPVTLPQVVLQADGTPMRNVVQVTATGEQQQFESSTSSSFVYEGTTCARLANGSVLCWGRGYEGQLGTADGFYATDVQETPVAGIVAGYVTLGGTKGCAITVEGTLSCWGAEFNGRGFFLDPVVSIPQPLEVTP